MRLVLGGLAHLARNGAGRVAERAVTLGHAPDGRCAAISSNSSVPTIEPGAFRDEVVISAFVAILDTMVARFHMARDGWMLRAHRTRRPTAIAVGAVPVGWP